MGDTVNEFHSPPTKGKLGKDSFSWEVYVLAFVITLIIFGIGVFLGVNLSKSELEKTKSQVGTLNDRIVSMQILMLTSSDSLGFNESMLCEMYETAAEEFEQEAWEIGEQIDYLEVQRGISDRELKSTYSELEFRNYMLTNLIRNRCNVTIHTILYFYSNDDKKCSNCFSQGIELFEARRRLLETGVPVRIYSFDGDLDIQLITMLKTHYDVRSYPTLVIDGTVYHGFMSSSEILSHVLPQSS